MGKEKKAAVIPEQVTVALSDPGMTVLHKVGLAGLWMTLKAFEQDKVLMRTLPAGTGWRLERTGVTLVCGPTPKDLFDWLIASAFRLDKDGFFWFPALGRPADNVQQAVVRQSAMLGTFLQHGLTRKADPSMSPGGSVNTVVDDLPHVMEYRRVTAYAHQKQDITPGKAVQLAGWSLPGGSERHSAFGETKLAEPATRALVLRFAPVGAISFELRARLRGVRLAYSLVLPEVTDLEHYARCRRCFLPYGVKQLHAAGSADAGMRVLAELHAAGLLSDLHSARCRVVSFGVVPWSTQQKTRVQLFTVRAGAEADLALYRKCATWLPAVLVRRENSTPFWDVPLVPDLVARNLAADNEWYEGFADLVADKDRRRHVFNYEREGLKNMAKDTTILPDGPERTFVLACQEALRRRMGQKHGRPGGADWGTEYEKVRVGIARCKNAATLRETVTDLWSRGGALHKGERSILKAGDNWWQQVLPLFAESNWRKAKDLALLALASYPGSKE
jgi:CRISPR-associated protein Cas8a1/Csx13